MSELCELKFNQVSFAGTHNSGSGFDGSLRSCNGQIEDDCIWRNQNLNITAQLDLGVRFLEVDLCLLQDDCNSTVYGDTGNSSLFTCYARENEFSYAGPVVRLVQQINDWMVSNPQKIIGIYFPDEFPGEQRTSIISELQVILEQMWLRGESVGSVLMSTHYNTYGQWPTLSQAIAANERIFIFLDLKSKNEQTSVMMWNHQSIFSTYVKPSQENNACEDRLLDLADRCNSTEDILIEAGVALGICIFTGQNNCNRILLNATIKCRNERNESTVNVVAVDFPELISSTVFEIVLLLNQQNILTYGSLQTTEVTSFSVDTSPTSSTCIASSFSLINGICLVLFFLFVAFR